MSRFAAIDVGTNSVLLLVAEKKDGKFVAVIERSEITRLGKGVDKSKQLAPEAIEATLTVIERFAKEARDAGALKLVVSATSAARDASNGRVFLDGAKARAGVDIEIISGDEEARLSFASAWSDFGGAQPLVVLDIGGGSTEFIFGDAKSISYRRSFDVGAVRMTERHIQSDPPSAFELEELNAALTEKFAEVPAPPASFRMIGIAGTATTLAAVALELVNYDPSRIQGAVVSLEKLEATVKRLEALPVHLRKTVAGVQEKRADVIVAGGHILLAAMKTLGAKELVVSDRGLRWGLLADRFGGEA